MAAAAAATTRTAARHLPHLLLLHLLAVCAPATVRCAAPDCWVPEIEYHHHQVTGTCLKATVVNGNCAFEYHEGMIGPGGYGRYHDSVEKCCEEVYSRGNQPMSGFPAGRILRDVCLVKGRHSKTFIIFKGQDLPAEGFDLPRYENYVYTGFTKVCGGVAAVAKACAEAFCAAFTYGGERDCGYLKMRFWDLNNSTNLKFLPSNKGWDVYAKDTALPSSIPGGKDPCTNPSIMACGAKAAAFPKLSGAFKV